MAATTTSDYSDVLSAYVLDFLKKKGFQRTAQQFADERRELSTSPPDMPAEGGGGRSASPSSPDGGSSAAGSGELPALPIAGSVNNGFLADWWSVFWGFFAVKSGRRPDSFAASEAMHTFVQHLAQQKLTMPQQQPLSLSARRASLAMFVNTNGKRRPSE
ncbi:hypothetical protein IWW38_002045 [Coemansia aciculifera]|uniref:Uncharacterized protein n=1 Tax=Coemansia aciculifera TaxID=417176 RepID=A0ACC1M4N6_9FUNG|nr:hypothetical protein IWW38_002045 [Coemansia aciculifera]